MSEWGVLAFCSDIVVGVCFLVMLRWLHVLLVHKRIGYSLGNWFNGVAALWLACAVYRFLEAISVLKHYHLGRWLVIANLFTAILAVPATLVLRWRAKRIMEHPHLVEEAFENYQENMRSLLEDAHDAGPRKQADK